MGSTTLAHFFFVAALIGLSSRHLVTGLTPYVADGTGKPVSMEMAATGEQKGPFGLSWDLKNPFESLGKQDPKEDERSALKSELLDLCSMEESSEKRTLVESTIEKLAPLSPTAEASTSPLLRREWKL